MIHAVVDASGTVVNLVEWDGTTDWGPPEGCSLVEVPQGTAVSPGWSYAAGAFANPNPPPPPSAPIPSIAGNYLWTAIADLGWLPSVQQAIGASKKPLDVQYANSTGKAETIFATDAKWGRIFAAAAILGNAATPAITGISLAAAVQHGIDLIASGT